MGAQRHVDLHGIGLGEGGECVLELEQVLEVRAALLLAPMDLFQERAPTELGDRRGRQRPRIGIADPSGDAGDLGRLPGDGRNLGRQEAPADPRRREVELLHRGERDQRFEQAVRIRGLVEDLAGVGARRQPAHGIESSRVTDHRDAERARLGPHDERHEARLLDDVQGVEERDRAHGALQLLRRAEAAGGVSEQWTEHSAVPDAHRPRRPLEHGEERLLDVPSVVQPRDLEDGTSPERSERVEEPPEAVADVVAASWHGRHHGQHAERLAADAQRSERPERLEEVPGVVSGRSRVASSTIGWSSWSAK